MAIWLFLLTIGPLVQEILIDLGFQPAHSWKLRWENMYCQPKKSLIFVGNVIIFPGKDAWWIRYLLWGHLMQRNSCIRNSQYGNWAYCEMPIVTESQYHDKGTSRQSQGRRVIEGSIAPACLKVPWGKKMPIYLGLRLNEHILMHFNSRIFLILLSK